MPDSPALTNAAFLVDPFGGHNGVPRVPCIEDIRNAWLDAPTERSAMDCLLSVPARWELP